MPPRRHGDSSCPPSRALRGRGRHRLRQQLQPRHAGGGAPSRGRTTPRSSTCFPTWATSCPPQAQAAEISGFVHHQREDRYDVLRSRPEVLADAKPGDADSFDAIHSVLTKYYRLVVIDSGNDESSPQWRAMIARADAIVVPTTTRPDHAESARLLLAELAGANAHAARLAENALVVVSQGSKGEPEPSQLVSTFQGIARAAVGIPYDPPWPADH